MHYWCKKGNVVQNPGVLQLVYHLPWTGFVHRSAGCRHVAAGRRHLDVAAPTVAKPGIPSPVTSSWTSGR